MSFRKTHVQISVRYLKKRMLNKTSCQLIKGPILEKNSEIINKLSGMMVNKRTHKTRNQYSCQICRKSFNHGSTLKNHMRIHTGEKPYKCQFCEKTFARRSHLETHTRVHTGVKPYKCHLCQKSFTQSGDLKTHMRTHTGEKPYSCQICQKSFIHGSSLKMHMRSQKPFKCQLCQKSFTQSGDLKRHMRIHTGEKPYKCQLCQKSFTHAGSLKTHMRTHTGGKPYKCQLCQKSFTVGCALKSHTRTHTGEKPYMCAVCNKGFTHVGNLKKHRRTHATEKQHKHNKPSTKSSSSAKQTKLHVGTQLWDLKIEREVIANLSDHFITFSSTDAIDKTNKHFSKNIYPDSRGIAGTLLKINDEECQYFSKFISPVHEKASLSKSFGCGICDELLEIEKEFLEHCSSHRFSPLDDLVADFC